MIKRMLKEYLDEYYSNALVEQFRDWTKRYAINFRISKEYKVWKIQIKKWKYNDEEYKTIIEFKKSDAINILCNIKEYFKDIVAITESYLKKE